MLWYVLQISVFVGVMASNIEWQWTPNGYLASGIALGAAMLTTHILTRLLDFLPLLHRKRDGVALHQESAQRRSQARIDVVRPRSGRR